MYSSMTTICLLPGIAASLLPFHRDFRSSCAIFRRPRKLQKRRPDGFSRIQPCEASVVDSGAHRKTAKKAPGRVLKDPTLRDFRSSCGYLPAPTKTAKKAPEWVLPNPALRGFRRRFRRPRKLQKRRPDGFSRIQPCEASVVDSGAHRKTAKKAPGRVLRIQPCEASVVVFALPASTEGNCLSLAKQGEFARMDAKKACENDRKRSRWIGRTRPGAGVQTPRAPRV